MNCLIDYVGINGCNETAPASGVYINSLPGIEFKMIDKVATTEQINFSGVWDDVQERAARRFKTDVNSLFKKKFKLKTLTQSIEIGKDIDTATTTASGVNYRGFTIELNDSENDQVVSSNLQRIYIQHLYLYQAVAVNTTIKIYDLDLGTVLKTVSLTGAIGWNKISVLDNFDARRIFVCYDATNINSVELDLVNLKNAVNSGSFCNCGLKITGASSLIASPVDITEGDNSFGLRGLISVKCAYDNIVCNNLDTFLNAWLFCLGIELMQERAYTSRLNQFTMFDQSKAKDLIKLFSAQYLGGSFDEIIYEGALTQSINGIDLNLSDCCIECNSPIKFVEARL